MRSASLVLAGTTAGIMLAPGAFNPEATAAAPAAAAPTAAPAAAAPTASSAGTPGNLLTGDQASFTSSTGGWSASGANVSWTPSVGDSSPGALVLTATGTQGMSAASGVPPPGLAQQLLGSSDPGGLVPATPGTVYAGGAAVEAATASQAVEPLLAFYGSSGDLISTVFGPGTEAQVTGSTTETQPSAWTEATAVSALAPSSTAWVALVVDVPTTTTGDVVYLDDAWILSTSDEAPAVTGPLHTSGNQIVDANGRPVTLRGVVLQGLEASSTAPGVTYRSVLEAKAWGANFIRLPLGEQFWLSTNQNCDYDPNYESRVDQVVNWITSLGMVVLLDLHYNTVAPAGTCEVGAQHDMADASQAIPFWSQVAARYAANPLVAFDLYNEPHGISDAVWLNGGTTTDAYGGETYVAAGMQQLYSAVRSTGADNLVFISGNNWANDVPSALVSGINIVYAVHAYTCPASAPPSCTNSSPYDPSQILNGWVGLSASQPVVVTEFGWPSQSDGTYNANVISYATSHGWGWSAFAWEQLTYPSAWDLAATWLSDGTAVPSPSGMPVLCALAHAASGLEVCSPPPIVRAVSPSSGPTAGGTTVTVTGTGFVPGNTSVYFGTAPGGDVSVSSADELTATSPSGSGTVDVTVVTPSAVSARGSSDKFTFASTDQTTNLGFAPLSSPVRIADTRSGATDPSTYAGETLCAGCSLTIDVPTGEVAQNASAIVAQLSAVGPSSAGFLSIYPAGSAPPATSNVNFVAGQDVGNLVTVGLGIDPSNRAPAITVLNGPSGTAGPSTDITLDLYGYYAPASATSGDPYVPMTPARIFDTRAGSGEPGQGQTLANGGSVQIPVTGVGGVPSQKVSAVVVNIGVTNTTSASFIQGYPTGSPPSSSTPTVDQNWVAGETLSTKAIIGVGAGGSITLTNHDGDVDVVVDVDGYFTSPGASGALFNLLPAPVRITDTRPGGVGGGTSYSLEVAGSNGVPAGATAGVLNVTDLATGGNFLTVYPAGSAVPLAADVNYAPGDTATVVANACYGTVGTGGETEIYNGPSTTAAANIVVDLFGYFTG